MKRTTILLMLTIAFYNAAAQAHTNISGFVTDENDNPIPGVVVIMSSNGEIKGAATTSAIGEFTLKSDIKDSLSLEFSHLSYETKTVVLRMMS